MMSLIHSVLNVLNFHSASLSANADQWGGRTIVFRKLVVTNPNGPDY